MGRLLRIQDRILLLLADIGDVFEELHDPGGWFKNYYQTLYGWVPYRYKRSNYKATFKRMLKVGYVEKIIKNGEPYLRLTSSGDKKLVRDFPIVSLKKKKWNGVGTLVIFDIEEIKRGSRDQLRLWLLGLGAGKVQKSAYLFSYDLGVEITEAVENFGLTEKVRVFSTTLKFIKDKKGFARKVWRLDQLEEEYQAILDDIQALNKQGRGKKRMICKIRQNFLEVLLADPMLPHQLLPEDWIGDRARKAIKEMEKVG